jgi:glutamyl-Q tRNA(Asp) synthetase
VTLKIPLPDPATPQTSGGPYRGRFAPSPTGPLHFGSVVAALGSFLQARRQRGAWLVRIEDLDPPRQPPRMASHILATLEWLGLEWDEAVVFQSDRSDAYDAVLAKLSGAGLIYRCVCSRKQVLNALGDSPPDPELGPVYPGTCRQRKPNGHRPASIRVKTPDEILQFEDALQGVVRQHLGRESGDFVLKRRGGLHAYQLAVVVDDAEQGITEVVRGADLLTQTPRQLFLQAALGFPRPAYVHLPLAVHPSGEKLSKQTGARDVRASSASEVLAQALEFLRCPPPRELRAAPPGEQLGWALEQWSLDPLRGRGRQQVVSPSLLGRG